MDSLMMLLSFTNPSRHPQPQTFVWVCLGCQNKGPQAGQLKQQKFIASHFWKLEVWDQGVNRAGFSWVLPLMLVYDGYLLPESPRGLLCVYVSAWLVSCVWLFAAPGSLVHGISQARILEWVAIFFSRGSSRSRDWNQVSSISCIAGRFFTLWAISLPVSKFPLLISIPVTALGPTLMTWCMRLHGLYPTRLLCPWGFSRQESWSGLSCPSPGDCPHSGIKPRSPASDPSQEDSLPLSHWGKFHFTLTTSLKTQFPNRVIFWGSRY